MDPLIPGLPLQGGQLQTIPGNASLSQVIVIMNEIINELNTQMQTQVFSDTSSKRLLIGYQKGGWDNGTSDFGIKVSIEGVDVTQAADDQLLFSMGLSTWKWSNSAGVLVKEFDLDAGVEIFYDPTTTLDIGQQGILPDGNGGSVWAKPGDSVNDAFGV